MVQKSALSPTALVILDGFGHTNEKHGNAIAAADMPYWHTIINSWPHALLHASGKYVGLLPGFIGNSEVGHLTLGAGRVLPSLLTRFIRSVEDGSLRENNVLQESLKQLADAKKALHIMGLLSDGGVHGHNKCLQELVILAGKAGIQNIYVHPFLDGRDVAPTSALTFLEELEVTCHNVKGAEIASIHGRFFAMDRDGNKERTAKSYNAICGGNREQGAWREIIENFYENGVTDEFIQPFNLNGKRIAKGDGIIFANTRPDRARQLTELFLSGGQEQAVTQGPNLAAGDLSFLLTATMYKKEFSEQGCRVLFQEDRVQDTFLDVLEKESKMKIFIAAESEKYAHVTYFFKGFDESKFANEERVIIPSLKCASYENAPEMRAQDVTNCCLASLREKKHDFYLINYANADMVGHSGNFNATVRACEFLDQQIGILFNEIVVKQGGLLFITADHGNAESMLLSDGSRRTAHTTSKVPFVAAGLEYSFNNNVLNPALSSVAPTLLKILGLPIPSSMSGVSLF